MIEVQIYNEEVYQKLKPLASYASDLTRVCAFRNELLDTLHDNGVEVDEETIHAIRDFKKTPILTIENGNIMRLNNASAEMLYFVGVRSEFDPTIPVRFAQEVGLILNSKLCKVDNKFREVYNKLGYRSKISELISANVRMQGKGKLIDFIDKDLTIQSLRFPDAREKEIQYKQLLVKVLKLPNKQKQDDLGDAIYDGRRYWEAMVVRCDKERRALDPKNPDNIMILRFYNRPIILKSILYPGNRFNIACSKITETQDGFLSCFDPIIIPEGLNHSKKTAYLAPTRSIPADLWRNALFEFQIRYNYNDWCEN